MIEQDLADNGIVSRPKTALGYWLEPALLMLHGALSIEDLWQAALRASRAALNIHNVSMALFPAESSAATLRVSNPIPDSRLNAAKGDVLAAVDAFLAKHPEACVLYVSNEVQEGSLIETAFNKYFLESESSRFAALMIFREFGRILGWLWLNRRAAQGDFRTEEMTLASALYVQFSVAAQRVCRFERERSANRVQVQNGRDDPATLLLDERYAPVFHNRAAVRICALWRLGPEQARILNPNSTCQQKSDPLARISARHGKNANERAARQRPK